MRAACAHIPRANPGTFICSWLSSLFTGKLIFQATSWRHLPAASGRLHCVNVHSEGKFWYNLQWWNLTFYRALNKAGLKKKNLKSHANPIWETGFGFDPTVWRANPPVQRSAGFTSFWKNVPGAVILFYSLQTPILLCRLWVPLVSHATESPSVCNVSFRMIIVSLVKF